VSRLYLFTAKVDLEIIYGLWDFNNFGRVHVIRVCLCFAHFW